MSEVVDIAIDCIYFECSYEHTDVCEHYCTECSYALCENCAISGKGFCEEQ